MKVRLVAAAAVASALGVCSLPAHATPYAGSFRYFTTGTMQIHGADGARWELALTATASGQVESRAEQSLYVDLSRCVGDACRVIGRWVRPLTAAEIEIDPALVPVGVSTDSSAHLHTTLGGQPLDVALAGNAVTGSAVDPMDITTTPPDVRPQVEQYSYAAGKATFAGVTCAFKTGAIGEVVSVDPVGDDVRDPRTAPPAALPRGFTGARHGSC